MAASKPILGVLESGSEVRCLIEDTHGGLCCEPGEYDKVEKNIDNLSREFKEELIDKSIVNWKCSGVHIINEMDVPVLAMGLHGYCLNTLHSYEFDGSAGFARMQSIMQAFRGGIKEFGGKKVVRLLDYVQGLDGLPKSDVLKFLLEDNCSLVVRPSGTEPKLKIYISVSAENKEMAEEVEDEIAKTAEKWIC